MKSDSKTQWFFMRIKYGLHITNVPNVCLANPTPCWMMLQQKHSSGTRENTLKSYPESQISYYELHFRSKDLPSLFNDMNSITKA